MPQTPAFRSAGAWSFTSNNVASPFTCTPGAPAGKAIGDTLFLVCESRSITATVATPSGWTLVTGFPVQSGTASGGRIYLFTRVADGTATDTPSPVWTGQTTGTTGDSCGAGILAYTGSVTATVDGTPVLSDLAAQAGSSTITGLTTAKLNTLVLSIAMKIIDFSGANASTWTERVDVLTTTGTGHGLEIADTTVANPGASGNSTVTWGLATSARVLGVTIGLAAAAAAFVDASTIASNSVVSSAEISAYTDTDKPGTITDFSGSSEIYTPGSVGTEYDDSDTTSSTTTTLGSVEVAEYADAATGQTTTTPSSVELQAVSDATTITTNSVLSSLETAQFVDAATNTSVTIPSATEIREVTDTGAVSSTTILTSVEVTAYVDTLTVVSVTTPASFEIREITDGGTVANKTTPSAVEVMVVVEQASVGLTTTISSTDLVAFTDTSVVSNVTTPSGVEGTTGSKTDADTVVSILIPSAAEIAAYVDQTTISGKASVTGVEGGFVDSNTISVFTTPAASDIVVFGDSSVLSNTTSLSAIEQATDQDTSVVNSVNSLSYSDISAYLESAVIGTTAKLSGSESYTPGAQGLTFIDFGTISTKSSLSYNEQAAYVETSTVVSHTNTTDSQITVYTDASTIASLTYPSAVEVVKTPLFDFATVTSITVLQPVEFVGLLSELAVIASYFRWNASTTYSRWYAPVPGFLRWGGKPLNGRLTTKVTRKWAAWKP